jgi:glucose/arabinose dehydrogenase
LRAWAGAAAVALAVAAAPGCGGEDAAEGERRGTPEPALERIGKFREPVFLAEPDEGDGTLYVVERAGTVRALRPDGELIRHPFLDVSKDVDTEGEGGLFSIAFEPGGGRRVFVAYSAPGRLVVERFTRGRGSDAVDPASRTELLSIPHPHPVHWGGLLAFGPDGRLYLGSGEGGPVFPLPSRAQNPRSLLGKLLRIDPRSGEAEVVALGLRNPWRYSFDRETGDLWIGDVGDFTQEEVNRVAAGQLAGANFGWPAREGTAGTKSELRPKPGDVGPVLTYSRTGREDDPRCAVTGGYVARDETLPSLLGKYLYADFCVGEIWSYDHSAAGPRRRGDTGLTVPRLASFAEDADGRIYALSLEGPVYRLVER